MDAMRLLVDASAAGYLGDGAVCAFIELLLPFMVASLLFNGLKRCYLRLGHCRFGAGKQCRLWLQNAAVFVGNAAIYGGNAAICGGNAAIYGGNADENGAGVSVGGESISSWR